MGRWEGGREGGGSGTGMHTLCSDVIMKCTKVQTLRAVT